MNWPLAITTGALFLLGLIVIVVLFVGIASVSPAMSQSVLRFVNDAGGWDAVIPTIISRRLATLPTTLLLLVGLVLVIGRLFPRPVRKPHDDRWPPWKKAPRRLIPRPAASRCS